MTGIYKITNALNGHFYIGLSLDIEKRFRDHKAPRSLKKNRVICRAMRKHGRENFSLEVLETCAPDQLSAREVFWISKLNPHYNMTDGGLGIRGIHHSEATRKRLSDLGKIQWAKKTDAEKQSIVRLNLTGWSKPVIITAEARAAISKKLTGVKWSEERREIQRLAPRRAKRYSGHEKWICQTDGEGWIYAFFPSVKSAAESFKIHSSSISNVLNNKQHSAAGLKWKLVSEMKP